MTLSIKVQTSNRSTRQPYGALPHLALLLVSTLVLACGGGEGSGNGNDAGSACEGAACADGGATTLDASAGDATPTDAGSQDADVDTDAATAIYPSLSDYRTCDSIIDCPVGLGECLKELSLSRADATLGAMVLISDVLPGVSVGQGVCSRSCVTDENACDTLSLKDDTGVSVAFTCQVVVVGDLAYPDTLPAFPFNEALDFDEMAMKRPFGSICRPPFELDADHIIDFCSVCDENSGCDQGTCWTFSSEAPVGADETGLCLEADTNGCPLGFESIELFDGSASLGDHCVPLAETCGPCQDRDGDTYGAGHCANIEIDCDDQNENAYYDSTDLAHAFPAFCGVQDFNCNGLSDFAEQVGNATYKQSHCEYCFDDFDGQLVQNGNTDEARLICVDGVMLVDACTSNTQVHCAGDPRMTGCEADVAGGGGAIYYRDFDSDDFGDPDNTSLGCPTGAPLGYVIDNTDCDDTSDAIHPGIAVDRCDCWGDCLDEANNIDNDCDNIVDEDVRLHTWMVDDDSDGVGESLVQFDGSQAPARCGMISANTVPATAPTPADSIHDCDSTRNNVYGFHMRVSEENGDSVSFPMVQEPPRDTDGGLFFVFTNGFAEVCDGLDNNCSAGVDNGVTTTYYEDFDRDTFGDPESTLEACQVPADYVENSSDCDDDAFAINTSAQELCDGIDGDCDGLSDTADGDIDLTTVCESGNVGRCAAGTYSSCSGSSLVCEQDLAATSFDDPASGTDDDDCDGPEMVIYVNGDNGDDPASPSEANESGFTMATAFKTIAAALDFADEIGADQIHLLAWTYDIGATDLVIREGIDIVGGFDGNGIFTGGNTVISKNSTPNNMSNVALSALGITATTTIAHLSIAVSTANQFGVSNYGIVANNSDGLRLEDVTITVSSATAGTDGVTPDEDTTVPALADGKTVLSGGLNSCALTDSANRTADGGNGGTSGAGGDGSGNGAGAGGLGSTVPGASATNVAVGGVGGSAGNLRTSFFSTVDGTSVQFATTGTIHGGGGEVGGGGGGGGYALTTSGPGGGAGGCPGVSGETGQNGGSAIGVFAVDSDIEYVGVSITAGAGGGGGDGANGANGGDGGAFATAFQFNFPSGSGSGGSGAGGGGSGTGGYSYAVFSQGGIDPCLVGDAAPTGITVPSSSVGGAAGLRGVGGQGGEHGGTGGDANDGSSGTTGGTGDAARCFFSDTCTNNAQCANGYCEAGNCYRRL